MKKENIKELWINFKDEFENRDDDGFYYDDEKGLKFLPLAITGLLHGIFNTGEDEVTDLAWDGFYYGAIRSAEYLGLAFLSVVIYAFLSLKNPQAAVAFDTFFTKAVTSTPFFVLLATDTLFTSWSTYPLSYKIGCGIKHIYAAIAATATLVSRSIKNKKAIKLEKKKELEKELAKEYFISQEEVAKIEEEKEVEPTIDDYRKLREEYAPTIPTELIAQDDKVLGLK